MNFRLVATTRAVSENGTVYDHTIWMGEFDGLEVEEQEAMDFARDAAGPDCSIRRDEIPMILH